MQRPKGDVQFLCNARPEGRLKIFEDGRHYGGGGGECHGIVKMTMPTPRNTTHLFKSQVGTPTPQRTPTVCKTP